jgi:hypothetical protein
VGDRYAITGPCNTITILGYLYYSDGMTTITDATITVTDITAGKSAVVPYNSVGDSYYLKTADTSVLQYAALHVYRVDILEAGYTYTDYITVVGNFAANSGWTDFTWDGGPAVLQLDIVKNGDSNDTVYYKSTATSPYDIGAFSYPSGTYSMNAVLWMTTWGTFNSNSGSGLAAIEESGQSGKTLP